MDGATKYPPDLSTTKMLDYDVQKVGERTFMSNGAFDRHYKIDVRPESVVVGKRLATLYSELENMFDDVLNEVRGGLEGSDLGRLVIHHADLNNPIVVSLRPLDRLSGRAVMDEIAKVLNSHQTLKLDHTFYIDVGTIELPKGGTKLPLVTLSGPSNSIQKKRSLIEIINDDNTCMARAIAMAFLATVRVGTAEWNAVRHDPRENMTGRILDAKKCPSWYFQELKKNESKQFSLAKELCKRALVSDRRRLTLQDIVFFENYLDVDILVVGSKSGNKFVRIPNECRTEEVEEVTFRKRLFLYLVETDDGWSHYHAIVNICGFFSQKKFCQLCLKPYDTRHQCYIRCFTCKRNNACIQDRKCEMSCKHCHMTCRSLACFEAHRDGSKSQCNRWWKCTVCKRVVDTSKRSSRDHFCGEFFCRCCQRYEDEKHVCYIRSANAKETKSKYIFFDFECRQEDVAQCEEGYATRRDRHCRKCNNETLPCKDCRRCINCSQSWCGKFEHVPNLVVAQKVCATCIHQEFGPESKCIDCGSRCPRCSKYDEASKCFEKDPCKETCSLREVIFSGDRTLNNFGKWLFHERNKGYTVLSHNFKAYDSYPILRYLLNNSIHPDKIIYAGSKVMYLHVSRKLDMTFIDSLNFLPMSLAKLPKAFGLTETKKGYFPHFFNARNNQNYKGPYPEPHFYGCDSMMSSERTKFLEWYAGMRGKTFNFAKEIEDYCKSDVDILRRSCLKFREIVMNITGRRELVMNEESGTLENGLVDAIDPFDSVTIASACMIIFKTMLLGETWRVKLRCGEDLTDWLPARRQRGDLTVGNTS